MWMDVYFGWSVLEKNIGRRDDGKWACNEKMPKTGTEIVFQNRFNWSSYSVGRTEAVLKLDSSWLIKNLSFE